MEQSLDRDERDGNEDRLGVGRQKELELMQVRPRAGGWLA